MSTKTLFLLDAIVTLLFGLSMTFVPHEVADTYLTDKTPLSATFLFVIRLYGVLLLSAGIAIFTARNAEASTARRALLLFILLSNAFTTVVETMATAQGLQNALGWTTVAITGMLAILAALALSKEGKVAIA